MAEPQPGQAVVTLTNGATTLANSDFRPATGIRQKTESGILITLPEESILGKHV